MYRDRTVCLFSSFTLAPEIIEENDFSMDANIYSLGVIFYKIVFGDYPFMAGSEY